jgi:hypothetical protein
MLMSMVGMHTYAYEFSAVNEDGTTIYYKFINEDAELEVIGGDNDASTIRIPDEVYDGNNGIYKPVTSIGDNAFNGYQNLTNIYIFLIVLFILEMRCFTDAIALLQLIYRLA